MNEAFNGYQTRERESQPASSSSHNGNTTLPGRARPVATEATHLKPVAKQTYLRDNKVQIPEVETVSKRV